MTHSNNFPKDKDFSTFKHSIDSNTENPFTETGLCIAIIEDLNDLRKKYEKIVKIIVKKNDLKLTGKRRNRQRGFWK